MTTGDRIRVPDAHVDALALLAKLPDPTFENIAEALSQPTTSAGRDDLTDALSGALDGSEVDPRQLEAAGVVDALAALEIFRSSHGHTPDRVARVASAEARLDLDTSGRQRLRERLERLLGAPRLSAAAKAFDLAWATERLLHRARLITDIRPVFSDDPEAPPLGAVLIHTLELTHYSDDGLRTFYVTLSDTDLADLAGLLDREQTKAGQLRNMLTRADVSIFDPLAELGS